MEILTDWRFWLFVITIMSGVVNWLANYKTQTNHLAHIDEKLDTILTDVKRIERNLDRHDVEIAVLKEKTR